MSISSLDELLILEEGERFVPYDDMTGEAVPVGGVCLGTLTAGVGHTGSDVKPGDYWTRDRSRARGQGSWPRLFQGARPGAPSGARKHGLRHGRQGPRRLPPYADGRAVGCLAGRA